MAFNYFIKYNTFYTISSKRYHTAAKQSTTAFFDSTFNHIRQNSQLIQFESLYQNGSKRYPNPHPATSITSNYLQYDTNNGNNNNNNSNSNHNIVLEDEKKFTNQGKKEYVLKNPINIVLPFDQEHIILSIYKNLNEKTISRTPEIDVSRALNSTNSKVNPNSTNHHLSIYNQSQQKKQIHTSSNPEKSHSIIGKKNSNSQSDESKYFETIYEDNPIELSEVTFIEQMTKEIEQSYQLGQCEKINSLYMAIKRNSIVPSRRIYTLVLSSIVKRSIDISMDDQNSNLLTVYQDLLTNKIKPDLEIYSIVLNQLLKSSILTSLNPQLSSNGLDFFKISIDIFNASNSSYYHKFDQNIMDLILIGMNLYPGLINHEIMTTLFDNKTFVKNHIYFISMINYCKFLSNSELALSLYEDFKNLSTLDSSLEESQFLIYSSLISTLVELNELQQSTKFLDKLLTSIKNFTNYESKINMLLSSYLISLSRKNPEKAFEIWLQFNKIDWIPEFSYNFYLNILHNSLSNYKISSFYYNYMIALPRSNDQNNLPEINTKLLETLLISPISTIYSQNSILTSFMNNSIDQNDKTQVLKNLKISFLNLNSSKFEYEIYPKLFQYLKNEELQWKIISNHGILQENGFKFLNFLINNNLISDPLKLIETKFFQKLIDDYSILKEGEYNYLGFYSIIYEIFAKSFSTSSPIKDEKLINLLSPLIVEFYDLENFYYELKSKDTIEFKSELLIRFKQLIQPLTDMKNLTIHSTDAIKLVNGLKKD
ncbi:hypothetical protein WICMUC_004662 [Wickerhamomyces mucosus]|uniref:Uncharacterized protein n=1 Tax=Wickerhamomyces mucosus TaxID=1378264 RepID=A0A9P8PGZ5_9ASCO|nr:hypothetical protein WICMUC_004662 [Wickerhamomyces mucosus]